jgi:transcriptional regulator with XRE-family HTH domain
MSEKTSPQGKRILALRKKVKLSRHEFYMKTGMSASTLKAFETGARNLPSQKARQLSYIFSNLFTQILGQESYETSFDYIFDGKKPDVVEEIEKAGMVFNDDADIHNEIISFTNNPSYSVLKVQNDLMAPYYKEGDVVAGRNITDERQFPLYEGYVCILRSLKDEFLLRRVIKSRRRKITCCILNVHINQNVNIVEEIEVQTIAQAIRHWHLSELVQSNSRQVMDGNFLDEEALTP